MTESKRSQDVCMCVREQMLINVSESKRSKCEREQTLQIVCVCMGANALEAVLGQPPTMSDGDARLVRMRSCSRYL